jgi:serine phosphatase RsbU (regulator of sigma subunit)/anti-anti-sigma regulatory factor
LEKPAALIVDDDRFTRAVLHAALEATGCSPVYQAEDGVAAQQVLREHPEIELVLTDLMMPRLDGLGLLRWARTECPQPVWVVLSALDKLDSAVEAIKLGAYDFLPKGPRVEELDIVVHNALQHRRLVREQARLQAELAKSNEELRQKVLELEHKSELIRRDLQRAEIIQRTLLPAVPPQLDGYSVHAVYRPGRHVGGDLYDVVQLDDHHLALYVADATGHGVTAAMLSVLFKQRLALKDAIDDEPLSAGDVLTSANRALAEALLAPGLFLSVAYALVNLDTGAVTFASAGSPPVVHQRAAGETRLLRRTGPALGLAQRARFTEERFTLEPGDRLLLYTDGLLYGDAAAAEREPLEHLLRLHPDSALDLARAVLPGPALDQQDADDITVLVFSARSGNSSFDNGEQGRVRRSTPSLSPEQAVVFYGESDDQYYLGLGRRATWTHCDAFIEAAHSILAEHHRLIIDLSECDYLDSTFLGTMHELAGHEGVRLQNVRPAVRELFEELSLDDVIARIDVQGATPLHLYELDSTSPDRANQSRVLRAHETLSAVNAQNRDRFRSVLDALSGS